MAEGAQTLVGGRYRLQAELGHGGSARVFAAVDERTGRHVALKKLIAGGKRDAAMRTMFEREYHTLVQLAHPRIVRAFDYGVDDGIPYYTMELLQGADARDTLHEHPPTVQQVCLWLRDTASALALIHSRRLVHRDVSVRNVWCTPDGRAKLIDLGTLVAMGQQTRMAGTAPFVPPEAVYMQALDARSDLYSLGALGYYLLTGHNAYPARDFGDLRQLWQRRPARPDARRSELPRALSDLVMAMLSLDPRGRPASAGEVIERLTAIGELPAEDERRVAQAFLVNPTLVGRDEHNTFMRKLLTQAMDGRGGTAAIVAPAGMGRSRMLASAVLEAKLMGAAAVLIDASAVGSGSFALAAALAQRALEVANGAAIATSEVAAVLGHASASLRSALGEPALAEIEPPARPRALTAAFVSLLRAASRDRPLLIAVDDVHRADGPSLGVLGRLSVQAGDHGLLLLTSCDAGMLEGAPPALEQLVNVDNLLDLPPLRPGHTRALLESLLGAVDGLDDAASWLHELSRGSPQTCMQYAQYLVDHGIVRYERGSWQLPADLREHALPPTLGAMIEAKIAELSDDARALALGLALARDHTRGAWQPENHVHIEDYPKLLGVEDAAGAARVFSALDELLCAGMVQQRDSYYVLGQSAAIDALVRVSTHEMRVRVHARLADIFAQEGYLGGILVVRQLQLAGEHQRAHERLLAFISDQFGSGNIDWAALRTAPVAECALHALELWKQTSGPVRDGILLRRSLLLACSVYDWSLARCGDQQLAQLRSDTGLVHWDATDPALPALQRTVECLKIAQQAHDTKPERERGLPALEAVRELAGCAMTYSGSLVNSHDIAGAAALPAILEPLRPLAPAIALIADLCVLGVDRGSGRELGHRILAAAERLSQAMEISSILRTGGTAINLHFQAVEDARRGRPRALVLMDRLAAQPSVGDDMFLVVHGRWLGRAFRGESAEAEALRKRLDVIGEDDVWRRKALLFVEAQLYALTGDLARLHRVSEAIAELAQKFPGWHPWLGFARGSLHRLRGELAAAESELRAALAQAPPGQHRAYVLLAPALAELLLQRDDVAGALEQAESIEQAVASLSLDLTAAIAACRVRALAESKRWQHEAARASLARAFALAREIEYDGLPLALLHEAEARVAIAARDSEAGTAAIAKLWSLLQHAHAPALIGAYEALRLESAALATRELPDAGPSSVLSAATAIFSEMQTQLSSLQTRDERAQKALEVVLGEVHATSGQLLLLNAEGLFAAAAIGRASADEHVLTQVRAYVQRQCGDVQTVAVARSGPRAPKVVAETFACDDGARLLPLLLVDREHGCSVLAGVALIAVEEHDARPPRSELLQAVSRCLRTAGDTLALDMDE